MCLLPRHVDLQVSFRIWDQLADQIHRDTLGSLSGDLAPNRKEMVSQKIVTPVFTGVTIFLSC
jgi:hypothetical protein